MRPIREFVLSPFDIVVSATRKLSRIVPDKLYIKLLFRGRMGYWPNLKNPQTYSEKLQWLKLYDRNPLYTTMVDKYAVKNYVAEKIGIKYIIPTLGVWNRPEDIDWDTLPDQFVLKCTHDSGGLVICKDKSGLDKAAAIDKLRTSLNRNYYLEKREWPYKNVPRRIIAEHYLEDEFGELRDYKFFCFNGVAKILFIATDRQRKSEETKFDFFDEQFNHLDFRNGHPNADIPPSKPRSFEEMKILANKLSENIPQVRVDFYEVNGKVYFGELTLFHWSGMKPFDPNEWDLRLGQMIQLPFMK